MPNFITLDENKKVNNIIIVDSFEAAEEFCGVGAVIAQTEANSKVRIGDFWDGTTFVPAPVEESVRTPVEEPTE